MGDAINNAVAKQSADATLHIMTHWCLSQNMVFSGCHGATNTATTTTYADADATADTSIATAVAVADAHDWWHSPSTWFDDTTKHAGR